MWLCEGSLSRKHRTHSLGAIQSVICFLTVFKFKDVKGKQTLYFRIPQVYLNDKSEEHECLWRIFAQCDARRNDTAADSDSLDRNMVLDLFQNVVSCLAAYGLRSCRMHVLFFSSSYRKLALITALAQFGSFPPPDKLKQYVQISEK